MLFLLYIFGHYAGSKYIQVLGTMYQNSVKICLVRERGLKRHTKAHTNFFKNDYIHFFWHSHPKLQYYRAILYQAKNILEYNRVAPMRVKILNQPGSLTESCSFLCGFRNWFQILGCPQELRATAPRSWACTQWASSPWRHYQMNLKLKFYYVNLLYWVKKYLTKNLICY